MSDEKTISRKLTAYEGFPVVPETETDGWFYGAISYVSNPDGGSIAGDGFVQAPDGTHAGLVWGPDETDTCMTLIPPDPQRWGVYAIRFPRPISTVEDLVYNFRAILPDLNQKYAAIRAASLEE